jgi:hypothetical protein
MVIREVKGWFFIRRCVRPAWRGLLDVCCLGGVEKGKRKKRVTASHGY